MASERPSLSSHTPGYLGSHYPTFPTTVVNFATTRNLSSLSSHPREEALCSPSALSPQPRRGTACSLRQGLWCGGGEQKARGLSLPLPPLKSLLVSLASSLLPCFCGTEKKERRRAGEGEKGQPTFCVRSSMKDDKLGQMAWSRAFPFLAL